MKKLILFFLVLCIAVWGGIKISDDPGYLLIAYRTTTIEMPLWLAVVCAFIGVITVHFLLRLIGGVTKMGGRFRRWHRRRRQKHSQDVTSRGLVALTEGNWSQAEKLLLKASDEIRTPLINYLGAARAAQEQGSIERRDKYLRRAQRVLPDVKVAIELTQAQLQLQHGQLEQSIATLEHLQTLQPNHPFINKLLFRLYEKLNDWKKCRELLPQVRRHGFIKGQALYDVEEKIYCGLLKQQSQDEDSQLLMGVWHSLPKAIRANINVLVTYIDGLLKTGDHNTAETNIKSYLKKQWDERLVEFYGLTRTDHNAKQLSFAEGFLKHHVNDPYLLLTLGRLAMREKLWGKARTYLENSLQIKPRAETYAELANLLEKLDDHGMAAQLYRAGLKQSLDADKVRARIA